MQGITVLTTWTCLRTGIDVFVRHFPLFMGAWLVILAVQQAVDFALSDRWPWIALLVQLVLIAPLYAGNSLLALTAVRHEPASFRLLFRGFPRWGTFAGITLLTALIVLVGFALFVIPGIIWAVMFAFAPIVVLDPWSHDGFPRRVGILDAMKRSRELTHGYRGVLFGLSLLLGLPSVVIGVLVVIKAHNPAFPLPLWALDLLALLSGTLFLGPVSAVGYMYAYSKITSLERSGTGEHEPPTEFEPATSSKPPETLRRDPE
jgi:hypothetical protein